MKKKKMLDSAENSVILRTRLMYKKSHRHSGKITQSMYAEVLKKTEPAKKEGHQTSVSGMLKILGVVPICAKSVFAHNG